VVVAGTPRVADATETDIGLRGAVLPVCAAVVLGCMWARGRCMSVGGSKQRCARGEGGLWVTGGGEGRS